MKQDLHKKIEETMNSLDGLQRAAANPFLAARIRHRLREIDGGSLLPQRWSWRLAAVMIIFLVLNFITVKQVMKDREETSGAGAIVTEYSISLPQAY